MTSPLARWLLALTVASVMMGLLLIHAAIS